MCHSDGFSRNLCFSISESTFLHFSYNTRQSNFYYNYFLAEKLMTPAYSGFL